MKKIALVFMLLALVACTGGKSYILPPEGEQIAEVSDTGTCTFIKNSFAKGMAGLNLTRNIQLTTYNLGGDSYKIISTSNETKGSVNVTIANFQVWKCKKE
jgi:hypothetical protein